MMEKRRIAHLADMHLNGSDPSTALRCYEFALAAALAHDVDALALVGDIWHKRIEASDVSPLARALHMTKEFSEQVPVVVIYGNHDPAGSLDPFTEAAGRKGIFVVDRPQALVIGGIQFFGLPYPHKARIMHWLESSDQDATDAAAEDVLKRIITGFAAEAHRPDPFECPRVLMYHGNVRGCTVDSGQQMLGGDIMLGAQDLEQSGADYVALGHIHVRQQLGSLCHYSGSLYHNDFGEHGRKVMLIVDVWRGGYEIVEEIELPSRAKVTIEGEFDGAAYTFAGLDLFTDGLGGADVKLRMRMTPEAAKTFSEMDAERSILVAGGAASVRIERIIIPTERVRCAEITETRQLRDKVAAWGGATSTEIPAGVLDKADTLEGGA